MAWKWYVFFFQAAFVYEIIVVSFYWGVLFPSMNKDKPTHKFILECADHIVPFMCLLIEYLFLNSVPFVRRQFPFVVAICFFYLVFNCVYSLNYHPIYEPITWRGFLGIALPIALIIVGILFLFVFEYLTKLKLKSQGHTKIIEILEGSRMKQHYEKQISKDKIEA